VENLDGIMKLASAELGSVVNNGKFRSREEITSVGELIDMAKDIYCIWAYEEGDMEGGMSYGDGMSYNDGPYRGGRSYRGNSYDDGYGGSYARGRGRNAKRDSMGRYSREGSYRGYSRAESKEDMIESLREMMDGAPDEQTRMEFQRMIQKMEKA